MSTYRFISSETLTGRVLCDSLPIEGVSCSRQINQVGNFSGSLILTTAGASGPQIQQWVNALTPWKSILWVLQDGFPIWNGPITGEPHQSITDGTLPIQAASMEEFFKHRQISDKLVFNRVDIFSIFRQELLYALGKKPNGNIAGTGRYANTSGIIDNVEYSGVTASLTEQDSLKKIYDAWNDLVQGYQLEYALAPQITDAGSLFTLVQLGLPQMGRLYKDTGLQIIVPSKGKIDYAWQWVPSSPANLLVVTGQGAGTSPASYTVSAQAASELAAGFPLLEDSLAYTGTVGSTAQLQKFAASALYGTAVHKQLTPLFTLGGDAYPRIRDTQLGDEVMVAATSALHPSMRLDPAGVVPVPAHAPSQPLLWAAGSPQPPAGSVAVPGGPGVTALLRITGWTLNFPSSSQSEQAQFQLGGLAIGPAP